MFLASSKLMGELSHSSGSPSGGVLSPGLGWFPSRVAMTKRCDRQGRREKERKRERERECLQMEENKWKWAETRGKQTLLRKWVLE